MSKMVKLKTLQDMTHDKPWTSVDALLLRRRFGNVIFRVIIKFGRTFALNLKQPFS